MPSEPSPFSWNQVDHELVTLMRSLTAEEINLSEAVELRQLRSEARKKNNRGFLPSARIKLAERHTDSRAERLYKTYREVWATQGHQESAAFLRAVYDRGIFPLIAGRCAAVVGELRLEKMRTRQAGSYPAVEGALARRMNKLAARWKQRVEIDAKECEHKRRLELLHINPVHGTAEGAMEYPREFSKQAIARVEADRLKAGRLFEQQIQVPVPWPHSQKTADEANLRKYILRVFLVFAQQACKLGSQGVWTVNRIRSEAEEFLRRFTIEAYYDKGHVRGLGKMNSHLDGSILPEVQREFEKSAEWHQFEEKLLAVATVAGHEPSTHTSRGAKARTGKVDPRKALIARIKAEQPGIKSREVCLQIDRRFSREAPALRDRLAPLPSWVKQTGNRTWEGVYDDKQTHQRVRSFVNKVPPLRTRVDSSK